MPLVAPLDASHASHALHASQGVARQDEPPDVEPGDTVLTWRPAPPARRLTADEASHADAVRGFTKEAFKDRTRAQRGKHTPPPHGIPPEASVPVPMSGHDELFGL